MKAIYWGCAIPLILWRALVLTILWGWFVTPLGLAAISLAHMIGLDILLGLLARGLRKKDAPSTDEEYLESMLIGIFLPGMMLGVAFLAHLAMHSP